MYIAPSNELIYRHSQIPFRPREEPLKPLPHKDSILHFLDTNPQFSMFRELVSHAQFENLLKQSENRITLFVPSNQSLSTKGVQRMNFVDLKEFVGKHIARSFMSYQQLVGVSGKIPTYNTFVTDLQISPYGDKVMVNDCMIVGQKRVGNSMVYELDGCL